MVIYMVTLYLYGYEVVEGPYGEQQVLGDATFFVESISNNVFNTLRKIFIQNYQKKKGTIVHGITTVHQVVVLPDDDNIQILTLARLQHYFDQSPDKP